MEIRQLKAFLVIAETQTFTAGARRLNITQAAISMQIRQLEDELGIQLFTRTPRKVIITEAGQVLLERARTILNEHDGAICQIAEIAGGEYGRLRIGTASGMFASNQLPSIIHEIKRLKPKIDLTVNSGTSHELVERIMNGDIDSAFVSLPVDNLNIQTMTLFADELVAIAHPKHHLAHERQMTAAVLARKYAQLGRKTLLVDADLRKPSLARLFNAKRTDIGFAEVLLGDVDFHAALLKDTPENLDVLPVGAIPANPVDILSSQALEDFVDRVRKQYSLVIFDTPPTMGLADAPLLARIVDATVFIVEANRAHYGQAKTAIRRLRGATSHVAGVVLTKYRAADAGMAYDYQYQYYAYGNKAKG